MMPWVLMPCTGDEFGHFVVESRLITADISVDQVPTRTIKVLGNRLRTACDLEVMLDDTMIVDWHGDHCAKCLSSRHFR